MRKICHKNIQRQVTNLIPVIELCISLIGKVNLTQNKLNILPLELKKLKKKADFLNSQSSQTSDHNVQSELQKIEFELDSLVDDLEGLLLNLTIFDGQLKNVVVLKERLEAIQEDRIEGITPERIYKLLEKRRRSPNLKHPTLPQYSDKVFISETKPNTRQKIINFSQKFRNRKIAVSLGIIASLSLGWIAGYSSSQNLILQENKVIETSQQ